MKFERLLFSEAARATSFALSVRSTLSEMTVSFVTPADATTEAFVREDFVDRGNTIDYHTYVVLPSITT